MANITPINLGGMGNADLQAQQIALQRKQALLDALRQQSITPDEQQVVGNRVVPVSPVQGLLKLGQAYFAKKGEEKNTQAQIELGNEAAKRSAAALRAMAPPGTFDAQQAPDFSSVQPPSMSMGRPSPQPSPQMPQPSPQSPLVPDAVKQGWIRALSVYQTDPALGKDLIKNMAELTTEQKDMAAKGIDPRLAGALAIAKMRKEGIIEYQPGTTAQDLTTGQERFQPTLAPGINLNNGVASAIPGFADAQGQIAGAQTSATEAAKQPYQPPTTVNLPGGPALMTPAQQIAMANGQVPRGANAAPGIPLKTPAQEKFDSDQAAVASKEFSGMNDRVRNSTQLMMNVNESREALKQFEAGGGKETRAKVASMAQAMGASPALVDKIAGGDLGAMQEFKKIAAQQAMEALKSAMATDTSSGGRITQAEFKIFQDVNPNLSTDPRAIEKLYGFIEKQHNRNIQEQQQANEFIKKGGNPADWSAEWSKRLSQTAGPPTITSQAEYDALKSGQEFIEDGKRYKKP